MVCGNLLTLPKDVGRARSAGVDGLLFSDERQLEGVPITDLAAQLGHSRKSLTLDVYSHVLIDEGVAFVSDRVYAGTEPSKRRRHVGVRRLHQAEGAG